MDIHSSQCCPSGLSISISFCSNTNQWRVTKQPYTDPMLWFDDVDDAVEIMCDDLDLALRWARSFVADSIDLLRGARPAS